MPTDAPTPVVSEGLTCLRCQYDLTGLSGDPRTCPECGRNNTLAELSLIGDVLTNELRRLESLPTYAIAGAWVFCIGTSLLLYGWSTAGLVLGISGATIWVVATVKFGASCRFRAGWIAAQAWLYAACVTSLLLLAGAAYGASWFLIRANPGWRVAILTVLVLTGLSYQVWGRRRVAGTVGWPYRFAKPRFDAFCRETAVLSLIQQERNEDKDGRR